MSRFITEKETDSLLETENRSLMLPDGDPLQVRHFRIVWNSFDLIVKSGVMTAETITEIAAEHSAATGQSFEEALERVCGYAHRELKKL